MNYKKKYPDTDRVKSIKAAILNDVYFSGNHREDNEQTLNKLINAAVLDYIDSQVDLITGSCNGKQSYAHEHLGLTEAEAYIQEQKSDEERGN